MTLAFHTREGALVLNLERFALLSILLTLSALVVISPNHVARADREEFKPVSAINLRGQAHVVNFDETPFIYPDAPKGGSLNLQMREKFEDMYPIGTWRTRPPELGLVFESVTRSKYGDSSSTRWPYLISNLEVSKDERVYRFRVRSDVTFSDGTSVTNADIVRCFLDFKDKRKDYAFVLDAILKIYEEGSYVRLEFSNSAQTNKQALYYLFVAASIFKANPEFRADSDKVEYLGTGPYVIESFDPRGTYITYRRGGEHYWANNEKENKGRYNFDRITYRYIRDATMGWFGFLTGDSDLWFEADSTRWTNIVKPSLKEHSDLSVVESKQDLTHFVYAFNMTKPHLRDLRVRKAISLMFPFEDSVRIFRGGNWRLNDPIFADSKYAFSLSKETPESIKEVIDSARSFSDLMPEDKSFEEFLGPREESDLVRKQTIPRRKKIAEGLELLKKAGYELQRVNGKILQVKEGHVLSVKLLSGQLGGEEFLFKQELERIGVELVLDTATDTGLFNEKVRQNDYDLTQEWTPGQFEGNLRSDWLLFYLHSSKIKDEEGRFNAFNVLSRWSSPLVDKLIEMLQEESVSEQEKENQTRIARLLSAYIQSQFIFIPRGQYDDLFVMFRPARISMPANLPLEELSPSTTWWATPKQP